MNGGLARPVPGDYNASVEFLVSRLAPRFPGLGFVEVRYRVKSWKELPMCVADARAAIAAVSDRGAGPLAMVGYSMGGAVAITVAGDPAVRRVVALAPWIPDRLDLTGLLGRRLAVAHGTLDGVPGLPGTSPGAARRGVARARALGVDATLDPVRGGLHAIATRRRGRLVPLPRAGRWTELVARELAGFQASAASA